MRIRLLAQLWFLLLVNLKGSLGSTVQDDHPDLVKSIPGYPGPPPSKWYSGYLDYTIEGWSIHTHYILIEAEFDEDGDKPLIYWSNGGPGASSMYGLMTELGPLLFSDESLRTHEYRETGIPTPIYNEFSWTKLGSLLLFDAPAPVGFSYCDGPSDVPIGKSCGSWTDERASLNTYTALQAFYDKFPSYQSKDLFLTGESYAGIYIPNLAKRIVEGDNEVLKSQLQGFAVGDGCVGTDTKICAAMFEENSFYNTLFLAGHHQIPLKTFQDILTHCGGSEGTTRDSAQCNATVELAQTQAGGFYQYSLYDDCTYENGLAATVRGGLNDYPCGGGNVMGEYLNISAVAEAFHVTGTTFYITDDAEGFDYTMTEPSVEPFYQSVNGRLRVLVYNGDTDPRINSFDAQNWTSHLGFEVEQDWTPWTTDGCLRMGGYVTRYAGGFDFLTVRGAGHMVPTYKPEATFAFLKAWIEGTDYPAFRAGCKAPEPLRTSGKKTWSRDTNNLRQG